MALTILAPARESASDSMPINRPADDVREISLSLIDPPDWNPRRDFDEAELKQLAESLSKNGVGLLQPLVVRPRGKRFQVVAGERRYRAARRAALKTVRCTVRDLDDRQAAEAQLVENVQRADLNPLEIAVGFKALCDLGHTAASLAELVGAEESIIGARLGLLSLPDEFQSYIRQGLLTVAQAEYVTPWSDRPQILAAIAQHVDKAAELPLAEWKHRITSAAMTLSRSMDPKAPDGPRFDLSADNVRRLDVVTVELSPGKTVGRAMASGIWDELSDRVDRHESEPVPEPVGGFPARANGKPATSANGKHRGARQLGNGAAHAAKPGETAFGEPVLMDRDARKRDCQKRLDDWTAAWLRRACREAIDLAPAQTLRALAEAVGVDVAAAWRLKRDFLELFSGDELVHLAAELAIDISQCRDDRERVAVLLNSGSRVVPRAFRDALHDQATAEDLA